MNNSTTKLCQVFEGRLRYPKNWKSIAREVKDNANWTCEECGRPCRKPGVAWCLFVNWLLDQGELGWYEETVDRRGDRLIEKPQRFTLTVSHLDHNPANCDRANLRALCSGCHLRYDAKLHATNAAATRRGKRQAGQLSIDL